MQEFHAAHQHGLAEQEYATVFKADFDNASTRARLEGLGLTVIADKPDQFGAVIAKDSARMENIVKRSKAKISN